VESLIEILIGAPNKGDPVEFIEKTEELDDIVALEELVFDKVKRHHNLLIVVPSKQAALLLLQRLMDVSLAGAVPNGLIHLETWLLIIIFTAVVE
jgi:hypothetical protein